MKSRLAAFAVVLAMFVPFAASAQASPQTALDQCLVTHTSQADRTLLVKWIFAQLALSPDVAPLANISTPQRTQLNQHLGALVTRLLGTDCADETRLALGANPHALRAAFGVLGRTATQGLAQNPSVQAGMKAFLQYVDVKRLLPVLRAPAAKP